MSLRTMQNCITAPQRALIPLHFQLYNHTVIFIQIFSARYNIGVDHTNHAVHWIYPYLFKHLCRTEPGIQNTAKMFL